MAHREPRRTQLTRAISRSWLSIKQAGRRLLAELNYDLTFEQLMVLFILADRDGQNLRALASQADRDRTTMTRMIDGLERRNLVVRVPGRDDRRNKIVYLTSSGRKLTEAMETESVAFENQAFKGISLKQADEAVKVLNQISENLGYEE